MIENQRTRPIRQNQPHSDISFASNAYHYHPKRNEAQAIKSQTQTQKVETAPTEQVITTGPIDIPATVSALSAVSFPAAVTIPTISASLFNSLAPHEETKADQLLTEGSTNAKISITTARTSELIIEKNKAARCTDQILNPKLQNDDIFFCPLPSALGNKQVVGELCISTVEPRSRECDRPLPEPPPIYHEVTTSE